MVVSIAPMKLIWKKYRELVAESLVLLTVALSDRNGIIVVLVVETIISDVSHTSKSSTTVEVVLKKAFNARPYLDSSPVTSI